MEQILHANQRTGLRLYGFMTAMKGKRECMEYLEFYRLHESNSANKTSDNDIASRLAGRCKVQVKDFDPASP